MTSTDNAGENGLSVLPRIRPAGYFRWKVLIGRTLGVLLLVPALPIIGLLILLVRWTSKGPGIYSQLRLGRDGRPFHVYKLRTMYVDAEVQSGPKWTEENDPRITPLGRFLRKTHLDEFPQLFNVVRGEMTLIGPRPERPEFVQVLQRKVANYDDRMAVEPGITGLAQINLPPDTNVESVQRKVDLDREYIATANPLLDVRILLCTAIRLLGVSGDAAMECCGVKRAAAEDLAAIRASEQALTPDTVSGQDAGQRPTRVLVTASPARNHNHTMLETASMAMAAEK